MAKRYCTQGARRVTHVTHFPIRPYAHADRSYTQQASYASRAGRSHAYPQVRRYLFNTGHLTEIRQRRKGSR